MHLSRAESMPIQSHSQQQQQPVGPRTQCDQIIFEAMAKACEIVVRGRCEVDSHQNNSNQQLNGPQNGYFNGHHNVNSPQNGHRGTIQRQSSEITNFRSNYGTSLSQQQQQPRGTNSRFNLEIKEVPQVRQILSTWRQSIHVPLRLDVYYEHYDGGNGMPQRELLERWCIDYTLENNGAVSLRAVCKRIVCWLRSLHCLIRMLPAHGWMDDEENRLNLNEVKGTRGGIVGYSIYTTEESPSLPSPSFASKSLPSITTSYGCLSLSVMYDATLQMRSEPIPITQQKVIKDYHSPPLTSNGEGKRVMSGLSLVMMGEEENVQPPQQQQQQQQHQNNIEQQQMDADNLLQEQPATDDVIPWGSPATRAAFHLPPTYGGHSGYGYGYNGAQMTNPEYPPPPPLGPGEGLSISPSPLMSTPPQASMWGRKHGETPSEIDAEDAAEEKEAPPFTNPTSLLPTPTRSSQSAVGSHGSSLTSSHQPQSLERSSSDVQRKRTSSSSVLLPPVTSLDLLQKSPFSTKMTVDSSRAERADSDGIVMPFILESYRDEMLNSSIPRMISADSRVRTSSILGGGSSSNPMLSTFGSGGYYSSGPYSTRSYSGQHSHHTTIDADEMPFAVDDDFPLIGSASNPFVAKSGKSSCASGKGDAAFDTSLNGGASEVASSLAVSSLHQRCATEGKPRLKLFESQSSIKLNVKNANVGENEANNNDYATIKEQLSDFRSFGASLMVGSAVHDSCSE